MSWEAVYGERARPHRGAPPQSSSGEGRPPVHAPARGGRHLAGPQGEGNGGGGGHSVFGAQWPGAGSPREGGGGYGGDGRNGGRGYGGGDHGGDFGGDNYSDEFYGEDEDSEIRGRTRRSIRQRLILASLCGVIVLCLVGVAGAAWVLWTLGRVERISDVALDPVAEGDPINYLIIGSDERTEEFDDSSGHEGHLADSIVLFRVDPEEQTVALTNFPRDLLVPVAVDGEFDPHAAPTLINSAYASENGRDDLAMTIRQNFGININHFIEVNMAGFEQLVDSVGGIEVQNDQAIHDPRTGLTIEELGCVTLDGAEALQLVRSRHISTMQIDPVTGEEGWELVDPTADVGRNTRQREFIQQAVGKALRDAPSDPSQMLQMLNSLSDTVAVDSQLSLDDVQQLIDGFRSFDAGDPESFLNLHLPTVEDGNRLRLDEREAERVFNVFRGADPDEISPRAVAVTVVNGTGQEDQAVNTAGALQEVGFDIEDVREDGPTEGGDLGGEAGDTAEPGDPGLEGDLEAEGGTGGGPATTTVYHAPGESDLGMRVARHVADTVWVEERADIEAGTVEMVTGADFEGVYSMPRPEEEMPDTTPPGAEGEDPGTDDGSGAGEGDPAVEGDTGDGGATGTGDEESDDGGAVAEAPEEDNTFRLGVGCA